jgi:hypothetical protein
MPEVRQIGKFVVEPSLKAAWEHEYKYSALPIRLPSLYSPAVSVHPAPEAVRLKKMCNIASVHS